MKKILSLFSMTILIILATWQYLADTNVVSEPSQKINQSEMSPQSGRDKSQGAVKNQDVSNRQDESVRSAWEFRQRQSFIGDYDTHLRDDPLGQNERAPVDYYMLVLSWSPAFCDAQRAHLGSNLPAAMQLQCNSRQEFGWVVHGLWPQSTNARSVADHPRFCQGDLPPLPPEVLAPYLTMSPSAKLLQGEWEKHGSCAFTSAQDYFQQELKLFNALNLPKQFLNRKTLFEWMKQNNPSLKNVFLGASRHELFICYNLKWQAISCPKN